MRYYLVISEPSEAVAPTRELKFFEWFKHLKKNGRVTDYWALREKPGLAAVLRLSFESELEEILAGWRERLPSDFTIEPLKDPKDFEADLAKKLLG